MTFKLGCCADCLKHGDQARVYLVDSTANEDPNQWGFECEIHGSSKVFFIDETGVLAD